MNDFLSNCVQESVCSELGGVVEIGTIQSSMGPFSVLPDYKVVYPDVVIQALEDLYCEYNKVFAPLVEKNTEWETDYQCCVNQELPINFGVQVDIVGLPQEFLDASVSMSPDVVREELRKKIFEIENSLAMYQLLQELFSNSEDSFFKVRFRKSLNDLREKTGRKIALLAITDEKYNAMLETEFGKKAGDVITNEEVYVLTGFDRFFGPDDFCEHVERNDNNCQYLLYVRSSSPISKLRKPNIHIDNPLLDDLFMRRIVKANTLTFNIDSSEMKFENRINDTKEYMSPMDMAFPIDNEMELFSPELIEYLKSKKTYMDFKGDKLSDTFKGYLVKQGINPDDVASGKLQLRAKPRKEAYGCYGHLVGLLTNGKFRSKLRKNLKQRGGYVIQPEMQVPNITNTTNGMTYTYIDRVFFTLVNCKPQFLGGFRALMPVDSQEGKNKRIHGNGDTVWSEVVHF